MDERQEVNQLNPVPGPVAAPQLRGNQTYIVIERVPLSEGPPDETRISISGILATAKDVGRVIGWVTIPVWWPFREWVRDLTRIPNLWRIPIAHVGGWVAKFQADLAQHEQWTPAEQTSVVKLQASWTLFLVVSVALSFTARNWLPIIVEQILWWTRSHNLKMPSKWVPANFKAKGLPHFDVVRWALGYEQAPEPRPTIIDGLLRRIREGGPSEPL